LPETKVAAGVSVDSTVPIGVISAVDKAPGARDSSAWQPGKKPEKTIKQQMTDKVLRIDTW
jgi:hypothetical protein